MLRVVVNEETKTPTFEKHVIRVLKPVAGGIGKREQNRAHVQARLSMLAVVVAMTETLNRNLKHAHTKCVRFVAAHIISMWEIIHKIGKSLNSRLRKTQRNVYHREYGTGESV